MNRNKIRVVNAVMGHIVRTGLQLNGPKARVSIILMLLIPCVLNAESRSVEFSADMINTVPQGQVQQGKLYVSKGRTRMDINRNGQHRIHIINANKQVEWMLIPSQETYYENQGVKKTTTSAVANKTVKNPCKVLGGAVCKKLGIEKLGERDAVKWEISFSVEGKTHTGFQWLDVERNIPLKQQLPDGQITKLIFLGNEQYAGRSVEKWDMVSVPTDGAVQTVTQWYDPKLKIAIRQEFPGGLVSEISNIQEGAQADSLFAVPAAYTKISVPASTPSGR